MKYLLTLILSLVATSVQMPDIPQLVGPPVATVTEARAEQIAAKYHVDYRFAFEVADLAKHYERESFPRAVDILAIIGIESSFKPKSKSKLATDAAVGLTQIRPAAWSHKIKAEELATIDGQVRHGADILAHYYDVLRDKQGAVKSYNIGLNGYQQGKHASAATRYAAKYQTELASYVTTKAL